MSLAVVTIVRGRPDHLRRQEAVLAALRPAGPRIVVAMGDPAVRSLVAPDTIVVEHPAPGADLPLAAARNVGVATAASLGADAVLLLDVDCLPGGSTLPSYAAALQANPMTIACGPVTYLPPIQLPFEADAVLELCGRHRSPHPVRPDPAPGETLRVPAAGRAPANAAELGEHALLWSLSTACSLATWERIGGFDESYIGYGVEDTDFACRATTFGVDLVWVGGADAYHQHHPVSTPPVQHVRSIVRNGQIFADRWGWWPATGWLTEFERAGLVAPDGVGWRLCAR
ncbi:glycosyltransferase family 2 protein [Calidifontibacter sp. DB0510]|uniref:Glycosyltransferase family 2 protein n=1 Tax=Metallococcus carri TaxID=1656884 RepID=A0A967E8T3_9MICO|nr:galactosyltransferase-related protein [Metallococcus carri]NHN54510.1 glycosyltransferase family 2 protein [Metallococcus carri]NOP36651.1 glycosyltransferase family 2 protein [Calidifontibacter sp. DB2511S]